MAQDPYVKRAVNKIPHLGGKTTGGLGNIASQIKKVMAGSTSGLGNSGNNYASGGSSGGSSGGGGVAAPTALDSLPKTPEIQALIAKGLLRADMAPEQILAIVGMSAQVAGIPIDIAALKAQLAKDYASTTGGILGMGADWMQQMFGANMPDGNAAAYAADPMFAQYAESLGNQQATAGLNQATDQAWFDKQQQAMTDYYNGLMQSIAMGGGTTGGGGGGGGGHGGGGRRHYGGGGGSGGGSGNGNDWGFTDPVTTSTQTEKFEAKSSDRESQLWPEYKNEVLDAAIAQFGVDDPRTQYVLDTLDTTTGPDPALEQVTNDMNAALGTISARDALDQNNKTWNTAAPANFEQLRTQYQQLTGNTLGDTTPEDAFQWQTAGENTPVNLANIAPGSVGDMISQLMDQAYDPANPNALYGYSGGSNENIDKAADFFNRILNAGADRRDAKAQTGAQRIMAALQNRLNPTNGKGSILGGVGSYDPLSSATTDNNPYAPDTPGTYNPLTSANTGSISGSGPATNILSPESVFRGTYAPALNQTDQAANVSPYDSDLGRPLQNLYEQLAQANTPNPPAAGSPNPSDMLNGKHRWDPSQMGGWHIPDDVKANLAPGPQSTADRAATNATGGFVPYNPSEIIPGGSNNPNEQGITPAGAGINQLPPEIIAAAAQLGHGPPGINEINTVLSGAGFPTLDATGHLTGPIREPFEPEGTYGPHGFGSSRNLMPQDALLGMPDKFAEKAGNFAKSGDFTKPGNIQQGVPGQDSSQLSALTRAMQFLQDVQGASSEGPISGNTVYDQIIGNVAVTPPTTDQFGREVPSKLRPDILESMRELSGKQRMEDARGVDPAFFEEGEGQYWQNAGPELSGDALANAQMVNILAPSLRDMIRKHSTLWDMNPYSRHVDNTGTSTQQLQSKQKTYNPDVANAVVAGNLNDMATVPDIIQPYDETGEPTYDDLVANARANGGFGSSRNLGNIVSENVGGGGGGFGPMGLKSMAIRRIAQPTAKAPVSTGKSHIKPGGQKTYSKATPKKSYVTTGKVPYQPKNKKLGGYSKK
jgi:hypothetical protein